MSNKQYAWLIFSNLLFRSDWIWLFSQWLNSEYAFSPVPTKDMQIPHPPLLKSGHLDIKYAQCAENKDVSKISYHIISRVGAVGIQKGRFGHQKIQFSSKVAKFSG